ncbi:unnamed protein product [Spirodela intermedia]|uniref:Uncharacterized protein n=2 Tax=Spirodela intermedia TaxID=51605 RepID=A0A7I8K413_SPIIN|nr:unnamed protein product [Spirodela intermedia]CAA6656370.1 unnamed protein product [Spirodela intermedia]CAA7391940.1 unnamed protein product [Spirodela intermedia]
MGSKNLLHHLHGGGGSKKDPHHHNHQQQQQVRKGFLAVMVGEEGEERQRFVVPVAYLSHPLFLQLLKEAEEEYGFNQKGAIALPCNVPEFRYVQGLIDGEIAAASGVHGGGGGLFRQHSHSHPHHHHNLVACFRA